MPQRKPTTRKLGSLRGDLAAIAEQVQRAAYDGTTTVWADDRADVHAALAEHAGAIPSHWIVGSYDAGMPIADILDDLASAQRERSRNWILD